MPCRSRNLVPAQVVIVGPGRLTVKLPARCCGAVEGLCGRFSPDAQFQDIFTDAAGLSGQYPNRWFGGPYGGAYQRDFVESFRVPPGDPAALFTAAECPAGEAPAVVPAEPPKPFDGCPELEAQATAQCPRGRFYDNCVTDVGVTCDLSKWVDECKAAEDDFEDVDEGDVELPDETPECPPGGGHVDFEDLVGSPRALWQRWSLLRVVCPLGRQRWPLWTTVFAFGSSRIKDGPQGGGRPAGQPPAVTGRR